MLRISPFIILLLILATACGPAPITKEEMEQIAHANNARLEHFFLTSNADSLALVYIPDATVCPNGEDFVRGRDAIRTFWAADMKTTKTLEMKTETMSVGGTRDVIYETGRTHLKVLFQDTTYLTTVKYSNVWHRLDDGTYGLAVDIWNRDKSE